MTTLDWRAELIDQLDWHWNVQLRPRFEGLTDDEYFWEPAPGAWSVRRQGSKFMIDFEFPEPDPTPLPTIGWRLCHILTLFAVRHASHFGTPMPAAWWDAIDWPGTASGALEMLDASYGLWLAGIRSLDDAALARPVGPAEGQWQEKSFAALILHINREAIHHGAEVALLRDLYRAQPGPPT